MNPDAKKSKNIRLVVVVVVGFAVVDFIVVVLAVVVVSGDAVLSKPKTKPQQYYSIHESTIVERKSQMVFT